MPKGKYRRFKENELPWVYINRRANCYHEMRLLMSVNTYNYMKTRRSYDEYSRLLWMPDIGYCIDRPDIDRPEIDMDDFCCESV